MKKGMVRKGSILHKDESIFIETETMFPNAEERMQAPPCMKAGCGGPF